MSSGERLPPQGSIETANQDLEAVAADYEIARRNLIEELKQVSLPDLVRILRRENGDPLGDLAGSSGVYNELAAVHFELDKPAAAFNFMLTMGLRHITNEELDTEASKARDWVLREWGQTFSNFSE